MRGWQPRSYPGPLRWVGGLRPFPRHADPGPLPRLPPNLTLHLPPSAAVCHGRAGPGPAVCRSWCGGPKNAAVETPGPWPGESPVKPGGPGVSSPQSGHPCLRTDRAMPKGVRAPSLGRPPRAFMALFIPSTSLSLNGYGRVCVCACVCVCVCACVRVCAFHTTRFFPVFNLVLQAQNSRNFFFGPRPETAAGAV